MDNVRPIRPGVSVYPSGAVAPAGNTTVALANEIADARQSASNWRLAFFGVSALAAWQWYMSSGRSKLQAALRRA